MKKFTLLLVVLFLFSGCSDYKELTNIAIVSGLSIDKTKNFAIKIICFRNNLTTQLLNSCPKRETTQFCIGIKLS